MLIRSCFVEGLSSSTGLSLHSPNLSGSYKMPQSLGAMLWNEVHGTASTGILAQRTKDFAAQFMQNRRPSEMVRSDTLQTVTQSNRTKDKSEQHVHSYQTLQCAAGCSSTSCLLANEHGVRKDGCFEVRWSRAGHSLQVELLQRGFSCLKFAAALSLLAVVLQVL